MKKKTYYTEVFRKQALEKVYNRGNRTVQAVAEDLNMNPWTLKNWMKLPKETGGSQANLITKRPQDWSLSERFQLILDSQGKPGEVLSAGCLEQGIFPHHLQQWREAFESGCALGFAKKVSGALGGKGRMITLPERQHIIAWVDQAHAAGARRRKACELLGITLRTPCSAGSNRVKSPRMGVVRATLTSGSKLSN